MVLTWCPEVKAFEIAAVASVLVFISLLEDNKSYYLLPVTMS